MSNVGIYMIKNLINNKIYIGLSKNLKDRLYRHKSKLKLNKHHNRHLQYAYNYYGSNSFSFSVIEKCSLDIIDQREKHYINFYKSNNRKFGYNITDGGENFTHTKESKALMVLNRAYKIEAESANPQIFLFISPNEVEYTVIGKFESFCKDHNLSYRTMRRNIDLGKIALFNKSNPTTERINSTGWEVRKKA